MKIGELAEKSDCRPRRSATTNRLICCPSPSARRRAIATMARVPPIGSSFIKQAQGAGSPWRRSGRSSRSRTPAVRVVNTRGPCCADISMISTGRLKALRQQRRELARLYEEADTLDPSNCTDAHRCQVIAQRFFAKNVDGRHLTFQCTGRPRVTMSLLETEHPCLPLPKRPLRDQCHRRGNDLRLVCGQGAEGAVETGRRSPRRSELRHGPGAHRCRLDGRSRHAASSR